MTPKLSAEAQEAVKQYKRRVAASGGRAVVKKLGRKHMAALGRAHRTYKPCEVPRAGDPSKRHRFDPKNGVCWGCKKARKEVAS